MENSQSQTRFLANAKTSLLLLLLLPFSSFVRHPSLVVASSPFIVLLVYAGEQLAPATGHAILNSTYCLASFDYLYFLLTGASHSFFSVYPRFPILACLSTIRNHTTRPNYHLRRQSVFLSSR
ncbi:hypothetical protein HD806DRAFT_100759 [Xylariaceae sp. AK1471]|nr:hypothetical protein HD806DRAFT_100759 [Xylariaceae sp. AK1471]